MKTGRKNSAIQNSAKSRFRSLIALATGAIGAGGLFAAQAAQASCTETAKKAVLKKFPADFSEVRGKPQREIYDSSCELKTSKKGSKYQDCEVRADNGSGAGDVLYGVLLNERCSVAFQVFVIRKE
jgi:hypothetical protein